MARAPGPAVYGLGGRVLRDRSGRRGAGRLLERQPPPTVVCANGQFQDAVTVYVPVNDTTAPRVRTGKVPSEAQLKQGLQLLPENRSRQPRHFPTVVPQRDTIYFQWSAAPPRKVVTALESLCRKITYVGHSSSLVQAWVGDELPAEIVRADRSDSDEPAKIDSWLVLEPQPDGLGRFRLRVPYEGRLAQLAEFCEREQRPPFAIAVGYDTRREAEEEPEVASSHFSPDLVVLRQTGGSRFPLEATQLLTHHLRRTIMSACPVQPVPEWLSGHRPDRTASEREGGHMALVPLAHVGREHADGHLLGLAIVVPQDVSQRDVAACLNQLLFDKQGWPRTIELRLGSAGECYLELDDGTEYRQALRPSTWTGPASRWATVTPICLDRHPKAQGEAYWREVEERIAAACERIGLPRPAHVVATPTPLFTGSPHARRMPKLTRKHD
ncbi:MAG: type I-U CRISPR-associated protein Cas5/Cas6, partial [Planctomycetes bacterium]|nr:type I-U CRISPR-associated protein Cas5/Cas6 [Planctomycetota bacterium]